MKKKRYIMLIIISVVLITLLGCDGIRPEGLTDNGGQVIYQPITSIKAGLPYAEKKAKQWNKSLYLDYIVAGFYGKESIRTRKGEIGYYFYAENVKRGFDASAMINIDMKKNCFSQSYLTYGTAKELIGGGPEKKPEEWNIDINQAFDIAFKELDEKKIMSYENPKIVLRYGNPWEFAVYKTPKSEFEEMLVQINPVTGKVVRVNSVK